MVLLYSPPPVWGYYIAIAAVVAACLWQVYAHPHPKSDRSFRKPRKSKEHVDPSALVAAHAYSGYAYLYLRGKLLDLLEQLLSQLLFWRAPSSSAYAPIGKKAGPPIFTGWVVFYTRRLYRRIEDCWNRPIAGEASSSIDVCVRARRGKGDAAPLEMTGETVRCLNLGSYNYLGFGGVDEVCTPAVIDALRLHGVSTCASRLECGEAPVHARLEATVAAFLEKPAALVIGMGFATNATIIPVLVDAEGNGKGVLIVSDALNHSSIVEGVRGSGAKVQPFAHNDTAHLEAILQRATTRGQASGTPWRKIIIVVEGIYSMEGEFCRLREIVALKKRYRAYLYLDEAHSIGAVGPRGRGVTDHLGIPTSDVDVMMGTFTKSFGSVGGYIAASHDVVATLRRHAAGTLYAPAMSPPAAQQALSALELIMHSSNDPSSLAGSRMTQLRNNSNAFREGLLKMGCRVLGDVDSPVIPIMLYHPEKIYNFSQACLRRGLATVVVGFPATPLLLSRARFCIAASHTAEELARALELIAEAAAEVGVLYDKRAAAAAARANLDPDREAKQRMLEYKQADMEGTPQTEWHPEPLVPPPPAGTAPPHFDFECAREAAAATPALDLRRTDFLRLAGAEETKAAAEAALRKYGCGTCGPRGFYGTLDVHLELEKEIASFLGTEQSIIYSFGIATISSVVPAFVKPGDVLFVDSDVHFCAAVGTRLTRGQVRTFGHNSMAELEALLVAQEVRDAKLPASKRPRRFVLVEGLYANTGHLAPLPELLRLRDTHGAYLIVDETYSFGTLGRTGRGIAEHFGRRPAEIDILVGSLEHALGSVGGFCAGSGMIVGHQRLSGSGYCYSASLPAFATCAALQALRTLSKEPERLARLHAASAALHSSLHAHVAPLRHIVVSSDASSPLAQVHLHPHALAALSPERAQRLLRAAATAASAASVGVTLQLHSLQSHVQRPRPPSLRLTVHSDVPPAALDAAAAALAAALDGELAAIHEAVALALPPSKPTTSEKKVPTHRRLDSAASLASEGSNEEAALADGAGEAPMQLAEEAAAAGNQEVTVPILRLIEAIRRVSRQYVMRQMEWHAFSLTPSLHKLRAIDSPTLRALTTIGQLLGSEAFYFFIIPSLCWSASDVAHVPMFVAFFSLNIFAGCWLKNFFALARPPAGPSHVQRDLSINDATDFGWPSMYVVNAVGLPFFALRYWYGGFGTGTQYSMDFPVTTGASYTLAFVWVVLVCCARLYSGVSSPADVQGGLLVGGVQVRVWLSICDSVNEWIMSGASFGGLPQWAALLLMAVTLMAFHPYTPGDARSWVALSYSTKAVAFGTAFLIGAQACARYQLTNTLPQTATFYNAGVVGMRNLIGFVGMFIAWRIARAISGLIEAQLSQRVVLFNSKPCAPRLLRSAFVFSTMGAMVSFGAPALMSSAGM